MTRDYATARRRPAATRNARHKPTRKTAPGWIWMVAGILIGALAMNTVNQFQAQPEKESAPEKHPGKTAVEAANPPKPRFDFYTLLKESEVIVGDTPEDGIAVTMPSPAEDLLPEAEQSPEESELPADPEKDSTTTSGEEDIAKATPIPEASTVEPDAAAPKPAPAVAKEVYVLQAGSFKNAEDADNLRARLLLLNMRATVETVSPRPGETWHRVQIGPFADTDQLTLARSTLQQNGIASIQIRKTR